MIAFLEVKKEDVEGKTVVLYRDISRSFLLQFVALVVRCWSDGYAAAAVSETVKGVDTNTSNSAADGSELYCCTGGDSKWQPGLFTLTTGSDTGIKVGTGDAAFNTTAFSLGTALPHGRTTSTIEHFGTILTRISASASNPFSFDLEAIFRNSSGGTLLINEVGIDTSGQIPTATYKRSFCILRDSITLVTLLDGEYLKVKYTLQISV